MTFSECPIRSGILYVVGTIPWVKSKYIVDMLVMMAEAKVVT